MRRSPPASAGSLVLTSQRVLIVPTARKRGMEIEVCKLKDVESVEKFVHKSILSGGVPGLRINCQGYVRSASPLPGVIIPS